MQSCKDCLHRKVCKMTYSDYEYEDMKKVCPNFDNEEDFVEIKGNIFGGTYSLDGKNIEPVPDNDLIFSRIAKANAELINNNNEETGGHRSRDILRRLLQLRRKER